MSNNLDKVIQSIAETHQDQIDENGRHYLEVCLGVEAKKLGFADLGEKIQQRLGCYSPKGACFRDESPH
jgi:NADH:ubiquinone oxidoreductase subunit E